MRQKMSKPATKTALKEVSKGLKIKRYFTKKGENPLDMVEYEKRNSVIINPDGSVVFEMKDVEVPKSWSQLATDIVVSKYFRKAGVPETGNEVSVKQLVNRVSNTIAGYGKLKGYFDSEEDAKAFENELAYILVHQYAAFNSPVWFNCGLWHQYGIKGNTTNYAYDDVANDIVTITNAYERPQCSACFIQKVEDSIAGIFKLLGDEAKLFKQGSGTGTNFSNIRSKYEKLGGGGTSSGLISFLEVLDKGAGAIKSGGTTRRAAKMVCLDMDHPEIVDFIEWKLKEEKKAQVLIAAGYDSDFNGEAYHTVGGQHANNSVRLTDEFMNAILNDSLWRTTSRTTGEVVHEYKARELMDKICKAAWATADPGVQFDTTYNKWHTSSNSGKIRATNPCSEYAFLDDTACNLASINLLKLLKEDDKVFDVDEFRYICRIIFIAQEILVGLASYPTVKIAKNSYDYRPLGIGYANLGTLLMVLGIPYDSEEAFAITGAITAIMTGHSYRVSAEMADVVGPFNGYEKNKEPFMKVMNQHRDAAYKIDVTKCPENLLNASREDWDNVIKEGEKKGFRNAQASVLAPTGTIGLLMDCDTTGVEPDFSLLKWKKLAGGGYFKIVNQSVQRALKNLGYDEGQVQDILDYMLGYGTLQGAPNVNPHDLKNLGFTEEQIKEAEKSINSTKGLDEWTPHINPEELKKRGLDAKKIQQAQIYIGGAQTIEGAPHVKEEHYAVFDCANKCGLIGKRFIDPMGHINIMAAAQQFISGSISKTVNIPEESTVEDIEKIYVEAWRLGVKAVALYRDNCKQSQPLNTASGKRVVDDIQVGTPRGVEEDLPQRRKGITVGTNVGGQKIYVRTGEYEDGRLGEIFLDTHKEGAAYRSMMSCFAIAVSIALQHGVPLEKFVKAFTFTRFEPNGMTNHPNIKTATSVIDFVFRLLGMEYLGRTDFVHVPPAELMNQKEIKDFDKNAEAPKRGNTKIKASNSSVLDHQLGGMMGDAPACTICGHITVRNGSCYRCLNCGNSVGCS
jgi:ribonucleoside-diphosphate reductase alpha chain